MNKTDYIPHSLITSIFASGVISGVITIITKEGLYSTSSKFTTDNNGIHGEFYKEEVHEFEDDDYGSLGDEQDY